MTRQPTAYHITIFCHTSDESLFLYSSLLLPARSMDQAEVRNITTGRIVQVVEGRQIRLLYSGPYTTKDDPVLVVMQGEKNEQEGQSEKILALVETEEISVGSPTTTTTTASVWDEWDIQCFLLLV